MAISYEPNKSLYSLHTMHFPVIANNYIRITSLEDLLACLSNLEKFKSVYWLGGGSNTVFLKDFDGLIVHLNTKGIQVISETDEHVVIEVQAGENWHQLVKTCIKQKWFGLENLTSIPGTVGAVPVQNIGAYGVEVKDFIQSIYCVDAYTGKLIYLSCEECLFGYRNSLFKQDKSKRLVVISVLFKLSKRFVPNLSYGELKDFVTDHFDAHTLSAEQISNSVNQLRQKKLPDTNVLGNSGSFFHHPIVHEYVWDHLKKRFTDIVYYAMGDDQYKISASWMIDQLGLKGFRIGDMAVHEKQALVIVNYGNGNPNELLELMSIIIDATQNQFGIQLMVEPNLV